MTYSDYIFQFIYFVIFDCVRKTNSAIWKKKIFAFAWEMRLINWRKVIMIKNMECHRKRVLHHCSIAPNTVRVLHHCSIVALHQNKVMEEHFTLTFSNYLTILRDALQNRILHLLYKSSAQLSNYFRLIPCFHAY